MLTNKSGKNGPEIKNIGRENKKNIKLKFFLILIIKTFLFDKLLILKFFN